MMRQTNRHPFDIFNKKDVRFRCFHGIMETTYQNLHKEGMGVEIKHASIISEEEEAILWEQQILGCHSPKALVRAVFSLMEKNFVCEVGKNIGNSSFCNFRERMTTGSTPSMGLRISVEVLLTYVERIKWFGSLSQCWRPLRCEITWFLYLETA